HRTKDLSQQPQIRIITSRGLSGITVWNGATGCDIPHRLHRFAGLTRGSKPPNLMGFVACLLNSPVQDRPGQGPASLITLVKYDREPSDLHGGPLDCSQTKSADLRYSPSLWLSPCPRRMSRP